MAVVVELHNTGHVTNQSEIVASIEHVLHDEPGDWRISILGSRDNDDWEMKLKARKDSNAGTCWPGTLANINQKRSALSS